MNEKKIEPTQAMVDWAANILCLDATHTSLRFHAEMAEHAYRNKARAVMRTALSLALNHPDARGLFECDHTDYVHVDEAAVRVEAARLEGWDGAVDWIEEDQDGTTRSTIAARNANPYRSSPELPTEPGAVIIPADGHDYIEAEVWGKTYHASEAILLGERDWLGAWRSPHGIQVDVTPDQITPGTWKVGNR